MAGVGIFITHRTLPGQRDAVCAIWMRHMRAAVSANPDHLAYYYGIDANDPDVIRAFQHYSSVDAAAAFLRSPAYLAYVADVEGLLSGPPQVAQAEMLWQKPALEGADIS